MIKPIFKKIMLQQTIPSFVDGYLENQSETLHKSTTLIKEKVEELEKKSEYEIQSSDDPFSADTKYNTTESAPSEISEFKMSYANAI